MPGSQTCDICSRVADEQASDVLATSAAIELTEDGLWLCGVCRSRLDTSPVPEAERQALSPELDALVGKSAGAICRTLNLAYEPPFVEVIDAASAIAYDEDRYMSAWTFVALWLDGTTVWRSPSGQTLARRHPQARSRSAPNTFSRGISSSRRRSRRGAAAGGQGLGILSG